MGRPLKIAKAQAVLTITDTTAATDAITVSQNLNTLVILRGMQFVVASSVGGLTAGTTYWVLSVIDANNFTASATSPDANANSTPVALSDTTGQTVSATVGVVDSGFNNPNGSNTATNSTTYGVVGGDTAIYGSQVLARVAIGVNGAGTITVADDSAELNGVGTDFANTMTDGTVVTLVDGTVLGTITDIANATSTLATFAANAAVSATDASYVYATNEAGFILRQKGKQKYLVQGITSGLIGQCYTANLANAALTPNTMNVLSTDAASNTAYVQNLSDYNSLTFSATSGPVATGNIVLANAVPVVATFGTAYAANTYGGQPYPIVTIQNS